MACPYCEDSTDTCERIISAKFKGDYVQLILEMKCIRCDSRFYAEVYCDEPDWGAQKNYSEQEWMSLNKMDSEKYPL